MSHFSDPTLSRRLWGDRAGDGKGSGRLGSCHLSRRLISVAPKDIQRNLDFGM